MAALFSLEVLPASEGDCLLVHWGPKDSIAVIDGGPSKTFENTLRGRLEAIRVHRQLDTLPIDLVMVSHVDNDHIIGVRKLFAQLWHEQDKSVPDAQRPLSVARLWHNTFTDVLGGRVDSFYANGAAAALTAAASSGGDAQALQSALAAAGAQAGLDAADALDLALVLAGHAEGRGLRDDFAKLYAAGRIAPLNTPFRRNGEASPVARAFPPVKVKIEGLEIVVIGPSQDELEKLRADFDAYLQEKGLSAAAALAVKQDIDKSPTNLSSIVCLLKYAEKTILLTGDALGASVLSGLEAAGLLAASPLTLDILKVPHHGSARNLSADFFNKIHANTYVISADGKHGNPDRQSLEWLIASRPANAPYHIVFTYPLDEIDQRRRGIHERKAVWDPQAHGLEPLLDHYKDQGHAFTWSVGTKVIDLGDTPLAL